MPHDPPISLITQIISGREEWDGQEANTELCKRLKCNTRAVFLIRTVKYSFELLTFSVSALLTGVFLLINAYKCIQPFCFVIKFDGPVANCAKVSVCLVIAF